MQIIAMIAHRDKAPTNALLAKAVELCLARDIHHIHTGVWSRRRWANSENNRFELARIPRYYVPLNLRGKMRCGWVSKKSSCPDSGTWLDSFA